MASASGNTGSADETLRPASSSGSPQYDDEYLDRLDSRSRARIPTRSPVDDSNVSLASAEYDDRTLDAAPRPGPFRAVPLPAPSPPRQSPEERFEAQADQMQALYEELRRSNNIDELRAWVEERYYDAVRYEFVTEELKEIVWNYASEEQQQEAQEYDYHAFLMLTIIRELLERCRFNRALIEKAYEEKYQDWTLKFEREQKRQILRDRHQRHYDMEKRAREDEEHMQDVAKAVYATLMKGMQRAFIPRMESLTPNPDRVHLAVEEWVRTTDRILQERQAEVNTLIQKAEFMELRSRRLRAEINRLQADVEESKREEMEKTREAHLVRQRLIDLQNHIEQVNQEYHNRKFGRGSQPVAAGPGSAATPGPGGFATPGLSGYGTPEFQSTPIPTEAKMGKKGGILRKSVRKARSLFGKPKHTMTPDSPDVRRAFTSPEYFEEYPEEFEQRYAISDTPPGISPPSRRPSAFSQTFALTSPKRVDPVFVNIDIEPSNLIETASGECFVCDIKLDVQPGGLLPQLPQASGSVSPYDTSSMSESPVVKARHLGRRNIPPDVTPTSTRKYGLFTPKGIFKRGQLNIRRIPGKHPISELPWSPTYLPEGARSPITSLAPPLSWSDRSVSWEKKYESDYGSSPSPPPVIERPTYRSPDFLLSSSSPQIEGLSYGSDLSSSPLGTSYGYQSPDSDHSSPLPVIPGPGYRYQSPEFNLSSPSPVIPGYRSPYSDHSSASPTFVERFGRYPSPVSKPLFATPPSGYQSGLERSRTPESGSSPRPVSYQDPLNRRMQLSGMLGSSSYAPQTPGTPERGRFPNFASYQDPFNRRMQLDEMIESSSYAPQATRTPDRTYAFDSTDSERGYLESSLDSSLLNEARFLN